MEIWTGITFEGSHPVEIEIVTIDPLAGHILHHDRSNTENVGGRIGILPPGRILLGFSSLLHASYHRHPARCRPKLSRPFAGAHTFHKTEVDVFASIGDLAMATDLGNLEELGQM